LFAFPLPALLSAASGSLRANPFVHQHFGGLGGAKKQQKTKRKKNRKTTPKPKEKSSRKPQKTLKINEKQQKADEHSIKRTKIKM